MKKTHIIGIILIAISIGVIFGSINDSSAYSNFTASSENEQAEFHIVGYLNKEKPQVYEPEKNPDLFQFYMYDKDSVERKVILHKSKPQDFDRSEQIVIIGKSKNDEFHADQILMKCPSKYENGSPEFQTPEELEKERTANS